MRGERFGRLKRIMNYCFYLKKHTDTLIEQTRTKTEDTLDFVMTKQMETFYIYIYIYINI